MLIGIDARALEEPQTGVGRYLANLLENWALFSSEQNSLSKNRFVLYFKNSIPSRGILESSCFIKKTVKAPFTIKSNALFQHCFLPRQAKKDRIDILFSPSYLLPICYSGKTAVTIHDISFEIFPQNLSPADKFLLKKMSRISAKNADVIFTVSEFSKKEISGRYGISADKIFVTPLGADEKFFAAKNGENIQAIQEKFGIKGKLVLSIGTIFNRRHTDALIGAFAPFGQKFSQYQLLVIGKNHTYPFIDMDKKIREVNRALKRNAVLRCDSVSSDDLLALYGAAEALVYLSDYEGFGLPPLEAAASGIPVITSDIPAIRENMADAAVFVKNNMDLAEISRAMEVVATDNAIRNNLIEKGLARAKMFSWRECAKKTLAVLEKI
ncbi:glycosyltransferase family 4 protein [Patescibacteria group bacterium]|nr:glycosyltransferase family 4 protein [Patescibacteria group bacterium]MBU4000106.1 glycosyltransferase family 4 protein [Patescibacteria group bacterium]MBU4057018.1 glycosyltransferase family 4 protein [Patescibacteria group bacterium]